MKDKKSPKTRLIARYGFSVAVILAGLILNYLEVGSEFLGFSSIGSWLVYVGFIMMAIITLQLISKKKRITDERSEFVASKAARISFVAIILFAFVVMILDGIKPIQVSYSYFMSSMVCGIILVYLVSYKILNRKY